MFKIPLRFKSVEDKLRSVFSRPTHSKSRDLEPQPAVEPTSHSEAILSEEQLSLLDQDIWNQVGKLIFIVEGVEKVCHARILFDSQCEHDLVSSTYLHAHFGISLTGEDVVTIGQSITGSKILAIGKIEGRWVTRHLNKYESSEFLVVDSANFDVIIGVRTITRTGLYRRRTRLIAAFRPSPDFSISSEALQKFEKNTRAQAEIRPEIDQSRVTHLELDDEFHGLNKSPRKHPSVPEEHQNPAAKLETQIEESRNKSEALALELSRTDKQGPDDQPLPDVSPNGDREPSEPESTATGIQESHTSPVASEHGMLTASEYSSYSDVSSQSESLGQGAIEMIGALDTSTQGIHVANWLDGVRTVCHTAGFAGQQDGGRPQRGTTKNNKRDAPEDKEENNLKNQKSSNHQNHKKRRRKGDLMIGLLACPFAKFDPMNYSNCWEMGYDNSHYLKIHLRSCHYDPVHCFMCGERFLDPQTCDKELEKHMKQRSCTENPTLRWHGVDAQNQRWLQKRKTPKDTEDEYWMSMYKKLFGESLPRDPYIEDFMLLTLQKYQDSVIQKVSEQVGQRLLSNQLQPSPVVDYLTEAFSSARATLRPRARRTRENGVRTQRLLVAPSPDSGITHMGTASLIEHRAATPYQPSLASTVAQLEPTEATGTTPSVFNSEAIALHTLFASTSQVGHDPDSNWTFSDWEQAGERFATEDFSSIVDFGYDNCVNQPLDSGHLMDGDGGQSSADGDHSGDNPGPVPTNSVGQPPGNTECIDNSGEQPL